MAFALMEMFKGAVNSVEVQITADITATETQIAVSSGATLPDAPNLLCIGGDAANVETVKMTAKSGNTLTVDRAFQGAAQDWEAGTLIARNFTEYDHAAVINNIEMLNKRFGLFAMHIDSNGDLILTVNDGDVPPLRINENGCLVIAIG